MMGAIRHGALVALFLSPGAVLAQDDSPQPERAAESEKQTEPATNAPGPAPGRTGAEPRPGGADATGRRRPPSAQAAESRREARRRVRVRSSVTVIDPQADVGDIISEIRRNDRTRRGRGAATRARRESTAKRSADGRRAGSRAGRAAGTRGGRSAGMHAGHGTQKKAERAKQLEARRKRRDARLERRGDMFRRRTDRERHSPEPSHDHDDRHRH